MSGVSLYSAAGLYVQSGTRYLQVWVGGSVRYENVSVRFWAVPAFKLVSGQVTKIAWNIINITILLASRAFQRYVACLQRRRFRGWIGFVLKSVLVVGAEISKNVRCVPCCVSRLIVVLQVAFVTYWIMYSVWWAFAYFVKEEVMRRVSFRVLDVMMSKTLFRPIQSARSKTREVGHMFSSRCMYVTVRIHTCPQVRRPGKFLKLLHDNTTTKRIRQMVKYAPELWK